MRKTLLTMALVACSAIAAQAATILGATNVGSGGSGYPNVYNAAFGYVVDMSQAVTFTEDNVAADFTQYDLVQMESISLNVTGSTATTRLVVYELDSKSTRNFVGLCGVSEVTTLVEGANVFSFNTPFEFDATATYGVFFVNTSVTDDELSVAKSFTDIQSVSSTYRMQHTWSGMPGGEIRVGGTWKDGELPLGTYSIIASNVPEPATASLSLLGLAALMMRRRRA